MPPITEPDAHPTAPAVERRPYHLLVITGEGGRRVTPHHLDPRERASLEARLAIDRAAGRIHAYRLEPDPEPAAAS
jgi:hypothetical protein